MVWIRTFFLKIFLRIFFIELNLKVILINLIFAIFLYFFGFSHIKIHNSESIGREVELTYSLVKTVINEVTVLHSQSFSISHVRRTLDFIQHYFITKDYTNIQYNLSKFKRADGSYFNPKSHFNHYNLYLSFQEIQEFNNTLWMHQLTHNIPIINKFDFNIFSENDIAHRYAQQYISSCIRIVDSTYIEPFNDGRISNEDLLKFIIENKLKITNNFKLSINVN